MINLEKDPKILRYMDLTKLMDFVVFNRIYFCQVDQYDDIFEGLFPKRIYDLAKNITITKPNDTKSNNGIIEGTKQRRKQHYVSCWTLGGAENMALWKLYGGKNGIAIQTTLSILKDELENSVKKNNDSTNAMIRQANFKVSEIKYLDHKNLDMESIKSEHINDPVMYKNSAYFYENEVRFAYDTIFPALHQRLGKGFYISINAENIIKKCLISPSADECFYELIEALLSKYNLKNCVSWSDLRFPPFQ